LNEKTIQQVLEIEQQADAIYAEAAREAEKLPLLAEQEAQMLIEKARSEAEEEAKKMVTKAQAEEERQRILAEADTTVQRTESVAKMNSNKAIAYVLNRVTGKES
jgi:V/A-type H+-transporting ATPase subunit G/H